MGILYIKVLMGLTIYFTCHWALILQQHLPAQIKINGKKEKMKEALLYVDPDYIEYCVQYDDDLQW